MKTGRILKFLIFFILASFLALPLIAQDNPKIEIFGGYQFLHAGNIDGLGDGVNASGWNASAAVNFSKHLGIAADFSGSYKKDVIQDSAAHFHGYTYTFGPVASWNAGQYMTPFTHALFGGARLSPSACALFSGNPVECGGHLSFSGFATMLGGGADASISKAVRLRVFQADWVYLPAQSGGHANNVRFSTGLVFRF